MSTVKFGAVLGVNVAGALLGVGLPPAASGQGALMVVEEVLEIRAFRTGPLTTNTTRFLPVGRRDGTEVKRFDLLLFAFSAELNPKSVNARTIQVGSYGEDGIFVQAKGALYQIPERQFDFQAGLYYPSRARRKWWFFDPSARMELEEDKKNYEGFDPDTTYTVIVHGTDMGAEETVRARDGRRLARTFQTTFRTTSEPFDFNHPTVEGVEATDAPGVPLEGRTDVDPLAGIVVRFSEPMIPGSFYNDRTFEGSTCLLRLGGRVLRTSLKFAPDGLTCTLRPRRKRLKASAGYFNFILSLDVADRNGNSIFGDGEYVVFQTGSGT